MPFTVIGVEATGRALENFPAVESPPTLVTVTWYAFVPDPGAPDAGSYSTYHVTLSAHRLREMVPHAP